MKTEIPIEIVIKILKNVQSTRDLHSSLLANRIWCRVTIPILWELPLGQECYANYNKWKKKSLCIRTYISCMDTQARTLLIQNGFDLSSSPPQATFDYPSFAHKLIINNLAYFISMYSSEINPQQITGSNNDNNKNSVDEVIKSRILFSEMCKLIISRCKFVDSFKMTVVPINFLRDFLNHRDLFDSIFKLPDAPKVFKKLESFTSTIGYNKALFQLYESLKLNCNNILNMDLKLNSYFQEQLLAKLISVQSRLENLSIVDGDNTFQISDSIFWAIVSQKETLKSLRFKSVGFFGSETKSPSIGQFVSLQELYFEDCYGMDKLFLASSFTQLSSFHYYHSLYPTRMYPQEFIIKIFETANTNLVKIYLNLYTTNTILAILNYCTNIIKLSLNNLCPRHVIAVFHSDLSELQRFSFCCGGEGFDVNELLCQMAENVPESLETIEIKLTYYNPWMFSADSLRKFLESWCCKGGGGNKKIIVKRIEQTRTFTLSDEHFRVIEEYGVQFNFT